MNSEIFTVEKNTALMFVNLSECESAWEIINNRSFATKVIFADKNRKKIAEMVDKRYNGIGFENISFTHLDSQKRLLR